MPLILTLKRGEDFFVGDRRVVLSTITPTGVVLEMDGAGEVPVGLDWLCAGVGIHFAVGKIGLGGLRTAKIKVDAPDFRVLRGKLYRDE